MEFIRGKVNIRERHHGCVASVGNYDGIHLGHQQVINSLAANGRSFRLPTTIITFEPHPMEFFVPRKAPARLMTVREKVLAMQELGVDRLCVLKFNHELANTEPESFIRVLLAEKLGVRHIVVGDDFRFGRNRRGDFKMLCSVGQQFGISVERTESFTVAGERVSSTRIRSALAAGNLKRAAELLGRDYSMTGRVVRGEGNGALWGFPTANIVPKFQNVPVQGVFAVEVDLRGAAVPVPGAASVGKRPTLGGRYVVLEVHLLDFDDTLYGKSIRVRFLDKLRDQKKFSSVETMCQHIRQDIIRTREFFADRSAGIASCSA